jgi:hypothetical protein
MIINTSADPEHVGGNDKVGAAGVPINPDNFTDEERATVLSHENVLQRMSAPKNRNEKPAPTAMWPTETFTSNTDRSTSTTTRCRSSGSWAPCPTATSSSISGAPT